jgi:Na+/melibiose symporter-like transporter
MDWGFFLITPLGDKFNKKRVILSLQALLVATLGLVFLTTSLTQVWFLSILISFFSVSVQVIMPLAAGLSAKNRGKALILN